MDVALFEFMLAGKEYDVDLSKYPLLEEWYAQVAAVPSLVDYVSNRRYPSPGTVQCHATMSYLLHTYLYIQMLHDQDNLCPLSNELCYAQNQ